MKIYQAQILGPRSLVSFLREQKYKDCGDKFERFNELASQKFERMIRLSFQPIKSGKDVQNLELPCLIFAVLVLRKMLRAMEQVSFNRKQFLQDIKFKSRQILSKSNFSPSTADRFFEHMTHTLNDPNRFSQLFQLHNKYIYELINMCAQVKTKEFQMIDHYTPEQMVKISNVLKERIYFINYDQRKEALDNVPVDPRNIYLLKAKGYYFILVKLQEITVLKSGVIGHQELAEIFQIEHKLGEEVVKQSRVPSVQDLIQTKPKEGLSPRKEDQLQINLITNDSPLKRINTTTVSMLKSSSLFPEEVKCKICCKSYSQFNTLYWNYANYCLQCVVSPRVDVSFVPTSVIKKYLKSMKYDVNSPYHVVCPECQSQAVIRNYRVEDKVKEFQCKTCLKVICIEHQRLILQCFCFCMTCKKRTISIEGLFQKYCATCKTRLCEVCNYKGSKECPCICKECGGFALVDHDCKSCCHGCRGTDMTLLDCPCGKKLCPMCSFKNFDPTESICLKGI